MYNKNIGRSLCRRRPVSMPASAGLYARAGRSLCQSRPVSMPEPAGLYAGQPLFDCVAVPSGVFFPGKKASPTQLCTIIKKMRIFAILQILSLKFRSTLANIAKILHFFNKYALFVLGTPFLPKKNPRRARRHSRKGVGRHRDRPTPA